jgi:hypothetical protein
MVDLRLPVRDSIVVVTPTDARLLEKSIQFIPPVPYVLGVIH